MHLSWTIIYNDGNGITVLKESEEGWNEAPDDNVQYLILENGMNKQVISGLDEYTLPEHNTNTKYGKLISAEQWALTRQFMIYGDY